MPLRDALNLSSGKTSDPAPIADELVTNIAAILSAEGTEPDTYDMGAVFTGVIYALRALELRIVHVGEALAMVIGGDPESRP